MSKRILVVEDQPDNRQIIRDMLAPTDYEITETEDGEQALEAIAKQRPDLILMDIQLPIIDGYTATRKIKADPALRSIPIIAALIDVRFTPKSGHCRATVGCPLCAKSGLMQCSKPRYSITSSAMASTPDGMASPSAFAVLRLITSVNLVGCRIGKSAAFAPLSIFAA
jgi:hypothetical protein